MSFLLGIIFFQVCWLAYEKYKFKYYSIKTDKIESVDDCRWLLEKINAIKLGMKPWSKGYVIQHFRKNRFLIWQKATMIDESYEVIPNSNHIPEDRKSFVEAIQILSKQGIEYNVENCDSTTKRR